MTKPTIVQFGATGQVARSLQRAAVESGFEIVSLGRDEVDVRNADQITDAIARAPEGTVAIVNSTAYTAVDAAEANKETALKVNRDGPVAMANACREQNFPFIHISTDYVFDGTKTGAYTEADTVCPLGVYGKTKQAGEAAVLDILPKAIVLRTAWVFSPFGSNFVKTMIRLSADRDSLNIVDDQTGCPTPAISIARAIVAIVRVIVGNTKASGGIYHFAGDKPVSWKEFAEAIFVRMTDLGKKVPTVSGISTEEYPTPAKRPANSVLACDKVFAEFGIPAADWRMELSNCVDELLAENEGNSSDGT